MVTSWGPRRCFKSWRSPNKGRTFARARLVKNSLVECRKRGLLDSLLKAIIEVYRRKRDLMLEALSAYFPEEAHWTYPEGGFFIWVTLPRVDGRQRDAAASCRRGACGLCERRSVFHRRHGKNTIRLAYSQAADEGIVEGVRRLGAFLRARSGAARGGQRWALRAEVSPGARCRRWRDRVEEGRRSGRESSRT